MLSGSDATVIVVGFTAFLIGLYAGWAIWSPYKESAKCWKLYYERAQDNVERYREMLWKEKEESDIRELHQMD